MAQASRKVRKERRLKRRLSLALKAANQLARERDMFFKMVIQNQKSLLRPDLEEPAPPTTPDVVFETPDPEPEGETVVFSDPEAAQ